MKESFNMDRYHLVTQYEQIDQLIHEPINLNSCVLTNPYLLLFLPRSPVSPPIFQTSSLSNSSPLQELDVFSFSYDSHSNDVASYC